MSNKLQPVRGTHDLLPEEFDKFQKVVEIARNLGRLYGFQEMATPIFESTAVFSRSLGDTSDIVHKEMFTFETKGGESVTLRPEFTAGVMRAFISNGMQQHLPLKLFSTGPLFRYERPQKGRQRQFHQVNFEWLGDASPEADVELIILAGQLLHFLSDGKSCKLLINSLGDSESREKYREALVSYLTPYAKDLSEDSQRRLSANPLRILDSKSAEDQKIVSGAPKLTDYLSDSAKSRFDKVCDLLSNKNHPVALFQSIEVSSALVRGLDYYSHTVFEFVAETGELGAQNTVLAGGRYDGLVEQLGGKPTAGLGFAAGIERLLLLMGDAAWTKTDDTKIVILPFEEVIESVVLNVATLIRMTLHDALQKSSSSHECYVDIFWEGKISKRLERASKKGATHVVFMAPEEAARRAIKIKNLKTGEEKEVFVSDLADSAKLLKFIDLTL